MRGSCGLYTRRLCDMRYGGACCQLKNKSNTLHICVYMLDCTDLPVWVAGGKRLHVVAGVRGHEFLIRRGLTAAGPHLHCHTAVCMMQLCGGGGDVAHMAFLCWCPWKTRRVRKSTTPKQRTPVKTPPPPRRLRGVMACSSSPRTIRRLRGVKTALGVSFGVEGLACLCGCVRVGLPRIHVPSIAPQGTQCGVLRR